VGLDEKLEAYELGTKIPSYRKSLLSYCEGNVLETGVGTSRNVKYYPPDVKVTAVDWSPNMIEVALMKPRIFADIEYKIEDVENLSFADNSFDTVVDTFGLEYYVNPEKAVSEMKRVCKKDGLILVLTSGLSYYPLMNWFLDFKTPYSVCNFGYFPNRDWELFFPPDKFKVEHQQRKMNGTIYYYILRNLKD
jgi:ubiquinone/menaquinone biosynthesis C-methylase UbiE